MHASTDAAAGRHVLLVEDEAPLRAITARALEERGLTVHGVGTLGDARRRLAEGRVDLALIDIELGRESGLDLLRELRRDASSVPVVLVTGRASEADRLVGFELGAVDYVVKPFFVRELAARVLAHLRAAAPAPVVRSEAGRLVIDHATREVLVDDAVVALTAQEAQLLAALVRGGRTVQSREQLLRDAWGSSAAWQTPATVTEHVGRVRRKLAAAGLDPQAIVAVRGAGYRLDAARWS